MANELDEKTLLDLFRKLVQEMIGEDREIRATDRLFDDLELDSLDAIDLLSELEDRLGVDVLTGREEDLAQCETVSDLTAIVLSAAAGTP